MVCSIVSSEMLPHASIYLLRWTVDEPTNLFGRLVKSEKTVVCLDRLGSRQARQHDNKKDEAADHRPISCAQM